VRFQYNFLYVFSSGRSSPEVAEFCPSFALREEMMGSDIETDEITFLIE
jgi:hypothetical protein